MGRWNPVGIAIAALLFGVANVSQFMFQAMDGRIPYQFFLMLPYMLASWLWPAQWAASQPHVSWAVNM
ncbi:MAG: hypothetical protein O7E49_05925 [Gemmatimonadetes bacterium]|nr:hypothetical protein [Gemmatimonadota bacterium]